jgi:hypothetical protein
MHTPFSIRFPSTTVAVDLPVTIRVAGLRGRQR